MPHRFKVGDVIFYQCALCEVISLGMSAEGPFPCNVYSLRCVIRLDTMFGLNDVNLNLEEGSVLTDVKQSHVVSRGRKSLDLLDVCTLRSKLDNLARRMAGLNKDET